MNGAITIAGVTSRDVVTPRDLDELTRIVSALHAERKAFAFVGGGTELELGNAPRALDTVVRTTSLTRVVDYTPEDQTITVEAGLTFAELDRILAVHGQMLPLDVVDRERSTIGGVIATNAHGKRRQRYGTAKDLIVGVTIVRPDGVVARGGGKVVKNVAGFDLPKLMVGSLGTLGAIATVTLRLYPIPQTTRTLVLTAPSPDALAGVPRALIDQRLEPESVASYGPSHEQTLVVTFAGTRSGVDAQCATVRGPIAREHGVDVSEATLDQAAAFDAAECEIRARHAWRLRMTAPPEPPAAMPPGAAHRYRPAAGGIAYPLLGIAHDGFDGPDFGVAELRAAVDCATGGRGAVVVQAMPASARAQVDAWPPADPAALALMRAVKDRFDPHGLSNPGRFIGGI